MQADEPLVEEHFPKIDMHYAKCYADVVAATGEAVLGREASASESRAFFDVAGSLHRYR